MSCPTHGYTRDSLTNMIPTPKIYTHINTKGVMVDVIISITVATYHQGLHVFELSKTHTDNMTNINNDTEMRTWTYKGHIGAKCSVRLQSAYI